MGEHAEYMLNGDDCQSCGAYIGPGDGFPRDCEECQSDDEDWYDELNQSEEE